MNNSFSASKHDMHQLFVDSRMRFAQDALANAYTKYPQTEVEAQIRAGFGPVMDEINQNIETFAQKTENYEFVSALGLSNFYFGFDVETEISFEMKRSFVHLNPMTYEDLVSNIESATHIDCAITSIGQRLNFQIKRYPQARLVHTNEALLAWLDTGVFMHYGDMSGTILVILLQPNTPPAPIDFRFPQLSAELMTRKSMISFDEISVSYTDFNTNNGVQYAVLYELYPEERRLYIPMEQVLRRFRGQI